MFRCNGFYRISQFLATRDSVNNSIKESRDAVPLERIDVKNCCPRDADADLINQPSNMALYLLTSF